MSRETVNVDQFRTGSAKPAGVKTEGYTANGEPIDPTHRLCLAKAVPLPQAKGVNYFAVLSKSAERRLFDPMTDNANELGWVDGTAVPRWKMERVPEQAFRLYTRFLASKNPALLREAQRSI